METYNNELLKAKLQALLEKYNVALYIDTNTKYIAEFVSNDRHYYIDSLTSIIKKFYGSNEDGLRIFENNILIGKQATKADLSLLTGNDFNNCLVLTSSLSEYNERAILVATKDVLDEFLTSLESEFSNNRDDVLALSKECKKLDKKKENRLDTCGLSEIAFSLPIVHLIVTLPLMLIAYGFATASILLILSGVSTLSVSVILGIMDSYSRFDYNWYTRMYDEKMEKLLKLNPYIGFLSCLSNVIPEDKAKVLGIEV